MGQLVKSDTSIDDLFSKFALEPEETLTTKESTNKDNDNDKNKTNADTKNK